jgi:RHS repeat-associated protein
MTDWNGTTTYEYDVNGNVTKVTDANNQTVAYTWTKLGQKKTITYPTSGTSGTANKVTYTYDSNGNITKVKDTNNGETTYTYDALNQTKTKKLPNGAQSSYTYNKNGWLTQREETSSGASTQTFTYEYDKNGNRTKDTLVSSGTTETTSYTYDALNQLTRVTDKNGTRTYAFDEFNNRTSKQETGKETIQYAYNTLNQLVETTQGATTTTYDYDKRGNLSEVEENGKTTQTYTFDSTNKMSKAIIRKSGNDENTNQATTVTTKYTYDGAGNRTGVKVDKGGTVTSNTTYVVDQESAYNDIIMAYDSVKGTTSVFTFTDEVISVETSGNISYYKTDEKHSVTDILDESGKTKATIEYDEYGVIANPEVVSTSGNIFAYTGHVYDDSTGLYYAKARYYNAENGRFVSEDSYRDVQSNPVTNNLYAYVQNNPIRNTDPSGNIAVADDALIVLIFLVAGAYSYLTVRAAYLKTPEGQETLKNAKEFIYNGKRYLASQFNKFVTWVSNGVTKLVEQVDKKVTDFISWVKKKTSKTKKEKQESGTTSRHKIGEDGTKTTSKTIAQKGTTERIDVENPNPGQRDGQIHYHDPKNKKYIYDIANKVFMDGKVKAPSSIQKLLKESWIKEAIIKALKFFGEVK